MALGAYAAWAPDRPPTTCPRTAGKQYFLHHEWCDKGVLQWGAVAVITQTVARAVDMAAISSCVAPGPLSVWGG